MSGFKFHRAVLAAAICSALTACGGGGGGDGGGDPNAGIGGTGNVAGIGGSGGGPSVSSVGTVTGFGSVFVNGVEFFTSDDFVGGDDPSDLGQTTFEIDGQAQANDDGLKLGMVVRIQGQLDLDDNGQTVETSGRALSIVYDDNIEGPVSSIDAYVAGVTTVREFNILTQRVRVEQGDTVFDDSSAGSVPFSFASLTDTDVVEVSGFLDPNGVLVASRIERKNTVTTPGGEDGAEVEVKSVIDSVVGSGRFLLTNGLFVNYDPNNLEVLDDSVINDGGPRVGQFVEVKGVLAEAGTAINASDIELEDEGGFDDTLNDGDKASIEGLITELGAETFRINGQLINYVVNSVTYQPTSLAGNLANGLRVEAEGPVSGGTLNALKIESRSGDIKIDAPLQGIDVENASFTVRYGSFNISVTVDRQTLVHDDITQSPLTLAELKADLEDGSVTPPFLNIRAYDAGDGSGLVATVVELDDPDDSELEAPLAQDPTISNGIVTLVLNAGTQVTVTSGVVLGETTEFKAVNDVEYASAQAFIDSFLAGDFAVGDRLSVSLFPGTDTAEEVEVETGTAPVALSGGTTPPPGADDPVPPATGDLSGDGQQDDSVTP